MPRPKPADLHRADTCQAGVIVVAIIPSNMVRLYIVLVGCMGLTRISLLKQMGYTTQTISMPVNNYIFLARKATIIPITMVDTNPHPAINIRLWATDMTIPDIIMKPTIRTIAVIAIPVVITITATN